MLSLPDCSTFFSDYVEVQKGAMAQTQLKNFFKTVRRLQKNFKFSLLFVLFFVLIIAGAVIYNRHKYYNDGQILPAAENDVQLDGVQPSTSPQPQRHFTSQKGNVTQTATTTIRKVSTLVYRRTRMKKGSKVFAHRFTRGRVTRLQRYVVRHGDSLSKISLRHYRVVSRWQQIYRLNRHAIGRNPNLIYPRTTLFIYRR